MKQWHYVTRTSLAVVLSLVGATVSFAYYPLECWEKHAKDDLLDAEVVVIGRVTAVQRYKERIQRGDSPNDDTDHYCYLATITVGRTIRGNVQPGEDILFYTGSYPQREIDDTEPTLVRVANTHAAWTVDYNHVYLLSLKRVDRGPQWSLDERKNGKWVPADLEDRLIWQPRSCHFSINEVSLVHGPEELVGEDSIDTDPVPHVDLYFFAGGSRPKERLRVPLDTFLKAQASREFPQPEDANARPLPSPSASDPASSDHDTEKE